MALASRPANGVLGLGLGSQVLGLGRQVLGLGLGVKSLALASKKNSSYFGQLWLWPPPCKRSNSSLLSSYEWRRTGTGGQNVASQIPLPTVVKNYLGFVRQQSDDLSADAWRAAQQESQFTILHKLFEKVFCTPATSAPVECVLATVASSWDHTELGWGIGCWQI